MQFKTKDIGEGGLAIQVPVTEKWLAEACAGLDISPGPGGLALKGRLESTGADWLLRGQIKGNARSTCSRCLEPALVKFDLPVIVTYHEVDEDAAEVAAEADEDGGDLLTFSGGLIDLSDEIRDELLMAMPLSVLCKEDCAGLCPVCGNNRNTQACDCAEVQRRAASPFGTLSKLKSEQ